MKVLKGCLYALALLSTLMTQEATAYEVFATSFFSPETGDPDPGLTGVLKIDTTTGVATTFIPEVVGGLVSPTDAVVDATTNTLYVSSQNGRIWHYDATTGTPLDGLVEGEPAGVFALLPTVGFGDGFNTVLLASDGSLLAGTAFGSVTRYDRSTGTAGADLATALAFPSGLAETPDGAILVSVGDPFGGPGGVFSLDDGVTTTLIDFADSPGVRGASNPTVVLPQADFDASGIVDTDDYPAWDAAYGSSEGADANGDGAVNAADYTVWRDTHDDTAKLVIADLNGNQLQQFDLDRTNGETLAVIPPAIPDPLPPTANPDAPSNSPSEVLVTPEGTLLVSTLGLTRRPDNRGALLEFDRDGTLLRTIASDLPPLSGIAFAPPASSGPAVPEPSAIALIALAWGSVALRGRR